MSLARTDMLERMREMLTVTAGKWFEKMSVKECYESTGIWVFYHTFRWEGSTPILFLLFIHSFAQTPHYSRSVSLAALVCARCSCLLSPSLSCCCFKHDTGFGTEQLMIGCSALSPDSLAVLGLLFSSCWCCGNKRKIPNNSPGVYLFQSLNRLGVYLGKAFNSFLTKIRDENVTNFASFSVNSLASFWAQHVKKAKKKNVQCQWSRLLPWCFFKIN